MLSRWAIVFVTFLYGICVLCAENPSVSKPKPNGVLNGQKVSKFGHGRSILDIHVGIKYVDFRATELAPRSVYRMFKHIQVNDTELVALLPFKRKQKDKVTYDDLRYEVVNGTKAFDLLETFAEDLLETPMALADTFVSTTSRELVPSQALDVNNTVMYTPSRHHWKTKDALTGAVLPSYIIISIVTLLAYIANTRYLASSRKKLFKFSNVSRLLAQFVVFRLFFDVSYLVYLILFIHFEFFSSNGFFYFIFLFTDELINLVCFYFAVALFSQGFMTLDQSKKTLYKPVTIALTTLYFLSVTVVEFVYKLQINSETTLMSRISHPTYVVDVDPKSVVAPIIVLFKMAIFGAGCYFTYTTYKSSSGKEPRFLNSAVVIGVAYYFSYLITFPIFRTFEDFAYFLRAKFLSVNPNFFLARAEVPQVIQLVVICWLIYYWRDVSYEKVNDTENGYELE